MQTCSSKISKEWKVECKKRVEEPHMEEKMLYEKKENSPTVLPLLKILIRIKQKFRCQVIHEQIKGQDAIIRKLSKLHTKEIRPTQL